MNKKESIDFGMFLTGHDEETIIQMYNDWAKCSINSNAQAESRSVGDNEQTKKTCHFVPLTAGHYAPCYPKFKCHEKCE